MLHSLRLGLNDNQNIENSIDPAIEDELMTNKVIEMMKNIESDDDEEIPKSRNKTVKEIDEEENEDELFNKLLSNNLI